MIHPSYTEMMDAINSDVQEGEESVVQSRYTVVIAAAKRARQLISGAEPTEEPNGRKPLSIAVDELYTGKVKIIGSEESDSDDEKILEMSRDSSYNMTSEVVESSESGVGDENVYADREEDRAQDESSSMDREDEEQEED